MLCVLSAPRTVTHEALRAFQQQNRSAGSNRRQGKELQCICSIDSGYANQRFAAPFRLLGQQSIQWHWKLFATVSRKTRRDWLSQEWDARQFRRLCVLHSCVATASVFPGLSNGSMIQRGLTCEINRHDFVKGRCIPCLRRRMEWPAPIYYFHGYVEATTANEASFASFFSKSLATALTDSAPAENWEQIPRYFHPDSQQYIGDKGRTYTQIFTDHPESLPRPGCRWIRDVRWYVC